jgi:hypothetical protein
MITQTYKKGTAPERPIAAKGYAIGLNSQKFPHKTADFASFPVGLLSF